MEKYQTFQELCRIGIAVFGILGVLCVFGNDYFGTKKEEALRTQTKDTVVNAIKISNDSNNIKNGSKGKVKQNAVKPNSSLNAPNALIVTQHQTGGTNIVNYNGEKFNPANVIKKPILDENGKYGINILSLNVTELSKGIPYSFAANIPVNTKLKVILSKVGEDKIALWFIKMGTAKNWIYQSYKDGEQEFILDEGLGDLFIIFSETGSAKMKILFNGELLNEKIVSWK